MKRNFFLLLGASCSIIGSVIGAGFITGKEISVFFPDGSVSTVYLAFTFFFFFIFAMSHSEGLAVKKYAEPVISAVNVVIASCMVAGLNNLYKTVFRLSEYFEIFTIFTVIFAFYISVVGINGISVVSLVSIPVVLFFIVCFSVGNFSSLNIEITESGNVLYPVLYVGMNCLLSSELISDSTKKLARGFKLAAAFLVSLLLFLSITCISICISGRSGEMPFLESVGHSGFSAVVLFVITLFAIFTTLVSAMYSSFKLAKGKTSVLKRFLLTLVFFALSKLGFSQIVEKCYPVFGALGVLYFAIIVLQIFLSRRLRRTSVPQERTGRRCLPLRGRV